MEFLIIIVINSSLFQDVLHVIIWSLCVYCLGSQSVVWAPLVGIKDMTEEHFQTGGHFFFLSLQSLHFTDNNNHTQCFNVIITFFG